MLYQIYLQNGPVCWKAYQTPEKETAEKFLESAKAQYVYLRILDDKGYVLSLRCEKRQINGL